MQTLANKIKHVHAYVATSESFSSTTTLSSCYAT